MTRDEFGGRILFELMRCLGKLELSNLHHWMPEMKQLKNQGSSARFVDTKSEKSTSKVQCTVLHIYTQLLFWAGNRGNLSISSTNLRTNLWNFREKILRINGLVNLSFFKTAILDFLFEIFFCFIHMKISQRFLASKDWSKFWWLPCSSNIKLNSFKYTFSFLLLSILFFQSLGLNFLYIASPKHAWKCKVNALWMDFPTSDWWFKTKMNPL